MRATLIEGKKTTLDAKELGEVWENVVDIATAFKNYFSNIFSSSYPTQEEIYQSTTAIESIVFETTNQLLNKAFTQVEVEGALKQMAPMKSSGQDGFGVCFY